MSTKSLTLLAACCALGLLAAAPAAAQQHRARNLGHPSTRFAPPLTRPEQLRQLFRDERLKADVEAILRQAGFPGDVEDLRRAAATAEITEVQLPKGHRMPYMSSRKDGQPVALMDVMWVGERPVDAYAFFFASKGRSYWCVTPKACSNFFTEDLGPEAPALLLTQSAPAETAPCAPIEMKVRVVNPGSAPQTQVRVVDTLPAGLALEDGRVALTLEAGDLNPGAGKEFTFTVLASAAGSHVNQVRATSAEGARAEASATTLVRSPVLGLECRAPAEVLIGRPVEVCLTVTNAGDGADAMVTLTLPVPEGARFESATAGGVAAAGRVTWEAPALAPQSGRTACAVFSPSLPGSLTFAPVARGLCAQPASGRCATTVAGVSGILLEVVDLEDPVEVGKPVTYEIRVINQGSAPVTNVRLACSVPESQEFVSGEGASAVSGEARAITLAPLAALAPKAEVSWRLVLKALKGGDARFKVELTGDQFPRAIEEYEATQQY